MSVLQYSDSTLGYFTLKYCTLSYFAVLVFQSGAKIKTHLFFPISLVDTHSNNQSSTQGTRVLISGLFYRQNGSGDRKCDGRDVTLFTRFYSK